MSAASTILIIMCLAAAGYVIGRFRAAALVSSKGPKPHSAWILRRICLRLHSAAITGGTGYLVGGQPTDH